MKIPNTITQARNVQRVMTLDNDASPFGCCNFFDNCNDGIFSLYYRGALGLLDWMGFSPSIDCLRRVDFITYVRPEQSQGADTPGYISNPCADPNGIEFGACHLTVEDFGLYGREGPVRNLFKPKRYCKTSPRYFLDGAPVTSEHQWDMLFTMDALLGDLRTALITDTTLSGDGHFDGLQRWVRYGYDCEPLDSHVFDWNHNDMDGGAGITINGVAATNIYSMVEYLLNFNQYVNDRIGWSPLLSGQAGNGVDKIIAGPSFLLRCLLDTYACWSVCPGAQYAEVVKNLKDIREFRQTLNGGRFGMGKIQLDDDEISLMSYPWGTINGPTTGDLYFLTGAVGSQRIWEGEHLSAQIVLDELAAMGEAAGVGGFVSFDEGRVLVKADFDNLCAQKKIWMAPRLFCFAPWMQARFIDVTCHTPLGPLSPVPGSSFFPLTSFSAASCP